MAAGDVSRVEFDGVTLDCRQIEPAGEVLVHLRPGVRRQEVRRTAAPGEAFGLSRSGGPDITEQEFKNFIDSKVTPRFPDGLTVLSGNGQFKDSTGTIVEEGSKLLILLYPFSLKSSKLVDAIRDDYKEFFQQESVLRIDDLSCVSF